MSVFNARKRVNLLPGDHFFLLVGGVTTAAEVFVGGGEEVQRVVLEVLINKREENLTDTNNEV